MNFRKQSDKYVKIGNAYKLNSMYLGTSPTEMKPLRTYIKEYLLKLCLQQQKKIKFTLNVNPTVNGRKNCGLCVLGDFIMQILK